MVRPWLQSGEPALRPWGSPCQPRSTALDDQWRLRRTDFLDGTGFIQQIHRGGRRGCGYGVLVDDLLLTIAFQEHAERVETNDRPAQPHAIAQKNRDRRLLPLKMLEESILKAMNVVLCHLALMYLLVS